MINLCQASIYDIETMPNCFTLAMEMAHSDTKAVWEISPFRDDRQYLLEFFRYMAQTQSPMVGFNNLGFDYPVIHALWNNPSMSYEQIYAKAMQIIEDGRDFKNKNKNKHMVWSNNRFTPQIDLFKVHHFDNINKSTSLKYLQINMRLDSVLDMPIPNGTVCTQEQINNELIPYNFHDVSSTKEFFKFSKSAIEFRNSLVSQFGIEVLNWNDTKIGEELMIKRIGEDVCYDLSTRPRTKRQTPRSQVNIGEIILPYIKFNNPEFNRILEHLKSKSLHADELINDETGKPKLKTKGVLSGLEAYVGGVKYVFGAGGLHGAVENKKIASSGDWIIMDVDVGAMYPSIIVANKLMPEHMRGSKFTEVYASLPAERKRWQKEKGKKCPEANMLKLASNGVYGKSNSVYSPFYDPKLTMTTTINGQLSLAMLIDELAVVPTVSILQGNTDGVTFYIHKSYKPTVIEICKRWEKITGLVLEYDEYDRMFIKNVNAYIAIDKKGEAKCKKEYWTPDPSAYAESISNSQPSAWHKNLSNLVSKRAAVACMVDGTDLERYIRTCFNPFDFICSVKMKGQDRLLWGGIEQQKTTRFYISNTGAELIKRSPARGPLGQYKKANGVPDNFYKEIMAENRGQWDERVCTKNKSKYNIVDTSIMAGYKVVVCNNIEDFDFSNINYDWYLQEASKLVI